MKHLENNRMNDFKTFLRLENKLNRIISSFYISNKDEKKS